MLSPAPHQVFHVPLEERKYKDMNQFGEGDQAKVCVDIMPPGAVHGQGPGPVHHGVREAGRRHEGPQGDRVPTADSGQCPFLTDLWLSPWVS